MKKFWKMFRWALLAALLLGGYSVYRLGFGKPFTINELANGQVFLFLVRNPELFTQVGIIDGTILYWHSGRLADVGVRKRNEDYAMVERFAGQVREFDFARLDRQATEAVNKDVYPAYARMTAALESQRPAAVNQGAGVGRLPDGAAYYAATLKQMTTTDYTPEQVHQLGLSEAARVSTGATIQSQGFPRGRAREWGRTADLARDAGGRVDQAHQYLRC